MFIKACRMCDSEALHKFLDLGSTAPADYFPHKHQLRADGDQAYPLEVVVCDGCGLVQLNYVVPPDILYCQDYPYESSMTAAGGRHWDEFAETATRMLGLTSNDLVIDIGSNVGVLLQKFKQRGPRVLGIDPADNIAEIARKNGIDTKTAFFGVDVANEVVKSAGRAKVITGTNVFAHIGDLHGLMRAVDALLTDDGAFIIEAPYFVELLNNLEYDTIYHEHLAYISLKPLVRFFGLYGMEIFDVQRRDIHGGSIRIFVRRKAATPVAATIAELLETENREKIYDHGRLAKFAEDVAANRAELRALLERLKRSGARIAGVSAPAKGMTLLNYCGIGTDLLDFVTEKSRLKIGRYTPGVNIPVLPDEALLEHKTDYALLLAWNFADEIMRNLKRFSDAGGKFIIPIPRPKIVG
jgi:hypothetical protein